MSLPLCGLNVLDLTQVLSGPYATMLLADMGADVVKVEPPVGDATRGWGPWLPGDELRAYGGYFQSVNRNKRGVVLDLKAAGGVEALHALAARADVVVENFRVGVADRLGIGWEALHERFPRLVYAAIRGHGDPRTGASPYVDRPAYDIVAQGAGGLIGMTGPDPDHPVKTGPALGDLFPAALLTAGILAAVLDARASGVGRFVDVGMYDAVMSLCERAVYLRTYAGVDSLPQGNSHPLLAPYGVFETADGWATIAAPTDNHWAALAELIGRADLAGSHPFGRNEGRVAASDEVTRVLTAWTSRRTTHDVVNALSGRVPCGPVNRASDIVDDPHVAARRMLPLVSHPGAGEVGIAGTPVKFAGAQTDFRRAPLLGEHTDSALAEAGVAPEVVAQWRASGVFG